MKKYWRLISLSALLFITLLTLSACGTSIAKKDVLTEDMRSQRITWGVKADTRLFGLENIRTGKLEGFEIDLATAITKRSSAHRENQFCSCNQRNPGATPKKR